MAERRREATALFGLSEEARASRVVWLKQMHGRQGQVVGRDADGLCGAGDFLLTAEPNVILTARSADCAIVFIVGKRAIGIVHAGFQGTLAGVLSTALQTMMREFAVVPNELRLYLSPHICGDCYELLESHKALLQKPDYAWASEAVVAHGRRRYFSLARALKKQAVVLGVPEFSVEGPCTFEDSRFFSHRRGKQERMLSGIMVRRDA